MRKVIAFRSDGGNVGPSLMALSDIEFLAYDTAFRHEAPRPMSSIPHPKRELLKLCARIGYTPH